MLQFSLTMSLCIHFLYLRGTVLPFSLATGWTWSSPCARSPGLRFRRIVLVLSKHFEQAATLFGLTISTKKTVTLHQPPPGQTSTSPHIEIYGTPLKSVNNFTYLGSTIASDNTIDMEINNRIRTASGAFGGLWKRVWSQHGIAISTKCKVYKAVILPTLLYSAETYTLYRRHIRKLSQVHLRHLRQILRISWKDHISNIDVLRQANMSSIEAILTAAQLRWTRHVTRMSSDRLPKAVFYGELSSGKRLRGGQRFEIQRCAKKTSQNNTHPCKHMGTYCA